MPSRVRWMKDLLPDFHKYFTFLKKVARHEFRKTWFKRITTPVLEKKELFVRSIWEWTDVVDKEMYNVLDKRGRDLVMKPESTAAVMRSYIQSDMQSQPQPVYLYYIEPHFRYDRPQKWRYREFWQIWGEIIWENDPILDAQAIFRWYNILTNAWLEETKDFKVQINSIWTSKDREKFKLSLQDFYENKKHILCEDCKSRLHTNPLRLLDCKKEDCSILKAEAPEITSFFKKDSTEHYAKLKKYLDLMEVPYEENKFLVRWLDYYSHTVWEFVSWETKSQNAYGWGWRYDWLAKAIWHNSEIPAVGFALWVERIIEAMFEKWVRIRDKDDISLYFIQSWDDAKEVVIPLAIEARKRWINTLTSLWTPSLKNQLKKADRIWARYVAIIWMMEAKNWTCQIKDMQAWTQEEVKQSELIDYIISKIWEENLDFYSPARDLMIK